MNNMKQVFYKGRPYEFKVDVSTSGERYYALYEEGVLVRFLREDELDSRKPIAIKLDRFFSTLKMTLFA